MKSLLFLIFFAFLLLSNLTFAQDTCPPRGDQPRFAGIWGEFLLVGFVPVHRPSGTFGCSTALRDGETIELVESLLYAIDVFNNNTGPWEEKPSISGKLGIIIFDTCQSPQRASWLLSSWFTGRFHFKDESGKVFDPKMVVGIVGPLYSSVSLKVAELAAEENLAVVSYSATSVELSTQPTFLRTIPADDVQAQVMVDLLLYLKADSTSILYRDDNYGKMGYKLIKEKTEKARICLDKVIEIPFNVDELQNKMIEILTTLKSSSKIVILFVGWEQAKVILANAKTFNKSIVWIGTESWGNRQDFLQNDMFQEALGAFSINVERSDKKEVQDYISTLRPEENLRNEFFNESFEHYLQCSLDSSGEHRACTKYDKLITKPDPKAELNLKAVWSLALALSATVVDICGDVVNCMELRSSDGVKKIIKAAKQTKLRNNKGEYQRIFNERGDGNIAEVALNIQLNGSTSFYEQIGRFNGSLEITETHKTYDSLRREVPTPLSYCNDCNCPFRNKSDPLIKLSDMIRKEGDVYLIGMLPIHSSKYNNTSSLGGILQVEVIEAAVDYVNQEIFKNKLKLGYILFDTYSDQGIAGWHMTSLNTVGRYFRLDQYEIDKDRIIGLLLNSLGTNMRSVIDTADAQGIVQVDYGTRIGSSSTTQNYYFSLKYSIEMELKALVDIISYFNWKNISIVWSDSATGNLAYKEAQRLLQNAGICLSNHFTVGGKISSDVVVNSMKERQVELVLALIEDRHVRDFIDAVGALKSNYKLIGWSQFTNALRQMTGLYGKYGNATLGVVENVLQPDEQSEIILSNLQNISFTAKHNLWLDDKMAGDLMNMINEDLRKHSHMSDFNRIVTAVCSLSTGFTTWSKDECKQSTLDERCLNTIRNRLPDWHERWRVAYEQQLKGMMHPITSFKIQSYVLRAGYKAITIGSYTIKDGKGNVEIDSLKEVYTCQGKLCEPCQPTPKSKCEVTIQVLAVIAALLSLVALVFLCLYWNKKETESHYANPQDSTDEATANIPELPRRNSSTVASITPSTNPIMLEHGGDVSTHMPDSHNFLIQMQNDNVTNGPHTVDYCMALSKEDLSKVGNGGLKTLFIENTLSETDYPLQPEQRL